MKGPVMALISRIEDSWVRLYDDKGFKDRRLTVRYSDYPDGIANFKNVRTDDGKRGFGDKASSVKWQLATGWVCIVGEHDFSDRSAAEIKASSNASEMRDLVLVGDGDAHEIRDLGSLDLSDKASSLRWEPLMTDINEAWVELYDDKGFKDRRLTVRYLQYPDGIPDLKMSIAMTAQGDLAIRHHPLDGRSQKAGSVSSTVTTTLATQ
jgi:hypothetical protein